MDLDLKCNGIDIVIYGHSHKCNKNIINDILYINPGGAGRRRFKLPLTIALLRLSDNGEKDVEFIQLNKYK